MPEPACPEIVAELHDMLVGPIGDFARYRQLIAAAGAARCVEAAGLLETVVRRNAVFERAQPDRFEDVPLALEALAAIADRGAAPAVARLLADDHFSPRAGVAALRYLAAVRHRAGADAAAGQLGHDDPAVREAAAAALGALGAARHAEALAEALSDPVRPVAEAAALALALAGDPRGRTLVLTVLARAPAPGPIEALAALGDPEDGVHLARQAGHPDPAVRAAVATALADLDPQRFRRVLTTLASDRVPQVSIAARAELDN
jgi:HEAT repeat protein